jgi:hypothetical protein
MMSGMTGETITKLNFSQISLNWQNDSKGSIGYKAYSMENIG